MSGVPFVHAPGGHVAPELLDALVGGGLVGTLGALRALAQEGIHGAHDGTAVLVDDGRLRGDLQRAAPAGLDEAHGLAVVRLATQEEERLPR